MAVAIGALSLGCLRAAHHAVRRSAPSCSPGLALIVLGLLLFTRAPVDGDYVVDVLPAMLLLGVGAGLASRPDDARDVGGHAGDSGLASGLVNTTQQVGGALGLAVLATLSTGRTDDLLAGGESTRKGAHRGATSWRSPSRRGWWWRHSSWPPRC